MNPLMNTLDDLNTRLAQLAAGRQQVCDQIAAAGRAAGIGAMLMIGSLGRGGGDAFSDLDLILVPGPDFTSLDLGALFGDRVLAQVAAPRNAPIGGAYAGLCLDVAGTVLWLDAYTWPAATAAIPSDAMPLFDNLSLPTSELAFIPLITAHADPTAPAHPKTAATSLLRIAVAAKYLARGDFARIARKLPDAAGLPIADIAPLLRDLLSTIDDSGLTRAAAATTALVDLAEAARTMEGRAETASARTTAGLRYGTVEIAGHDPGWAKLAAEHEATIRAALGPLVCEIEHVGSTAVPGLPAKPIVDLAVRLATETGHSPVIDALSDAGYLFRGDKAQHGRLLFVAESAPAVRIAHIHVLGHGDPQWDRYLAVRNLLRARPEIADRYQALKRDLAARYLDDRAAYTAAKAAFFTDLLSAPPSAAPTA